MTKIANAVAPMKALSVARAVEYANNRVNRTLEMLAENNWNIESVFPYPNGNMSRAGYMTAKSRYEFAQAITKKVDGQPLCHKRIDLETKVEPRQEGIDRHIKHVAEDAGLAFDAYVYKLNQKVGEVVEAEVTTSWDLWMDSSLSVVKADGTKEVWNTKCITNYSKFGMAFNQFPTRMKK
jgi:hypothetical protein